MQYSLIGNTAEYTVYLFSLSIKKRESLTYATKGEYSYVLCIQIKYS